MIKIDGNFYQLHFSDELFYTLVKLANERKNKILKSFIKKLDLDPSLFEHLYNIDIFIDNNENDSNSLAFYINNDERTNEPSISLSALYVEELLDRISKNLSNKEKHINQLVVTLIHETIHCNRSIIVKNSIGSKEIDRPTHVDDKFYNELYDECDRLLLERFNGEDITILNVKEFNQDYEVVIYNRITDCFEYYIIDSSVLKNSKSIFDDIKKLINSNSEGVYLDFVLPLQNRDAQSDLVTNLDVDFEYQIPLSSMEQMVEEEKICSQLGLEEALTECLAYIIFESSNHSTFDKDEICTKLENDFKTYDIKIANEIFKQMDKDTIKWFILSCYEDEYTNRIKEFYKDDYSSLVSMVDSIYSTYRKLEKPDIELCENAIKLVKKNNR